MEKNVPKLRFPGFTEPWEQRKLGDIAHRVQGNDGRMNLPTLTISAGSGWMRQEDRFSSNIAGREQKNYTLLRQGQLSYNHGNSKIAAYGATFELQDFEEALVPRIYHSFEMINGYPSFIDYYFKTGYLDRELRKLVSSGARMDGLLNIGFDEFFNISIQVTSITEQMAIGSFFRQFDNLITLHQRKLDNLKELKKGLLQKMFPKPGKSIPEVRFPGFTDDWEQRKLKDLYEPLVERNTNLIGFDKTLSISSMSYKTSGNGAADSSLKNYKVLRIGDIAFEGHQSKEFKYGRFVLNDTGIGIMSPRFSALRPLTPMPLQFWKYYIHFEPIMRNILVKSTKAGTMMNELVLDDFLQESIFIPCVNEQKLIGDFYKRVDTLITLHQRNHV